MTVEDFDHVIHTNLRSAFLCTRAVTPVMEKQGFGRIILTSSITGPITGFPGWSHYGASKAGQLGFMRTAAIELARAGITVNAVMPGNIATEGLEGMGEEYAAKWPPRSLRPAGQGRGHRQRRALFASREAGFITGQTIVVDGGQVLPESSEALG